MATIGTEWTKLVEYTSTDTYSVTYRLYAKITATNIGSNTNTVQMKWTTQKTSGGSGVYDNTNTTPTVTYVSSGSTTATWTGTAFNIPQGSATTETDRTTSGNITITHDSNGSYTKTWNWSLSHVYEGGNKSGSVSVTLPTIPRASIFSLSSTSITTIGTTTATITRADSSFAHKITTVYSGTTYYLLGSASATSTSTSASLSIPAGLRNAMRTNKATSVTLTLTLTTYSGSTSIGTSTTQLTVSVPTATITVSPSSVACNSATTTWTLSNVDTEACVYTVQRLYGSTVRYTDLTRGTTTTKSSLANANFQANITTATSGTVTAKVTTYVGTSSSYTQVGTNTATYTVTIPTGTYKPSVSNISITRTGTAYGSVGYLSGYNGATIVFTTSITGNSAITSREVSVTPASVQYTTSISGNTVTVNVGTLPSSASNYTVNVVCTATDGRGTTASATRTFTATGYSKPTIKATIQRADASGNADAIGQYANISATATAPQTTFKMANVTIRYNSTSGTVVKSQNGTTQSITASVTHYGGSYDINTEYTFYVIATDSLGLQSTYKLTLPTASVVFSRHKNGGIGFGRIAKQGRVDSAYPEMHLHQTADTTGVIDVTNANYRIGLAIGGGNANRGIYDYNTADDSRTRNLGIGAWILYLNNQNKVQIPHSLNVNGLTINNSSLDTYYISRRVAYFGETNSTGNTDGWWKVASGSFSGYGNVNMTWLVMDNYSHREYGIICFQIRGATSTGGVQVWACNWLVRNSAYDEGDFMVVANDNEWAIYGYRNRGFGRRSITQLLQNSLNGAVNDTVTYYSGEFYGTTAPTGDVVAVSTDNSIVSNAKSSTSATNSTNIALTTTDNTSAQTTQYIPWADGNGNKGLGINNGVQYLYKQGTASAEGTAILKVGNGTAKGSASNKTGWLRIYGDGTYYAQVSPVSGLTAHRSFRLPDLAGTLSIRDATVTGTLTKGSWVNLTYPTGYTKDNCHVTGWDVDYNGNYRTGDGLESSAGASRVMVSLEASNIKAYTNSATYDGKSIRVFLSLNA